MSLDVASVSPFHPVAAISLSASTMLKYTRPTNEL